MAEELDTSWFDLKNYEKFIDLDLAGWNEQLTNRWYYYLVVDICEIELPFSINDFTVEELIDKSKPKHSVYSEDFDEDSNHGFPVESQLITIITNLKQGNADDSCAILSVPTAPSVYDVSALDVANMALNCGILNMSVSDFHESISAMNRQPVTDSDRVFRLNINLHATDEQIKYEFSQWLANHRKIDSYQAQKKLVTQIDFDYWNQYGVIPYLDLMLLAKIEGKKITQHKLAKLIFPNEYDIDITGRIRETTKPEADRLIKKKNAGLL